MEARKRPKLFTSVVLLWALGASCAAHELPPAATTDELAALGVAEGIGGRSATRSGDCSPGCPGGLSCGVGDTPLTLVAAPSSRSFSAELGGASCTLSTVGGGAAAGFAVSASTLSGFDSIDLRGKSLYSLALAPGEYRLVVHDGSGCARCIALRRTDSGADDCGAVVVTSGNLTQADVLLDFAAE